MFGFGSPVECGRQLPVHCCRLMPYASQLALLFGMLLISLNAGRVLLGVVLVLQLLFGLADGCFLAAVSKCLM